ncbi:MAG: hypothetical protein ACLR8Y_02010 [Alistipes indistinctus]
MNGASIVEESNLATDQTTIQKGKYIKLPIPAENSTQLTTTKGDKKGGEGRGR